MTGAIGMRFCSQHNAVQLHLVDRGTGPIVTKVWRFDGENVCNATRASVQEELVELFPDVSRRGPEIQPVVS